MIAVLRGAIAANPQDARAPYYLGNLLFDWQPTEAVVLWQKSVSLDPAFPIAWRNLAQAYSHQTNDDASARAIDCLEHAVALDDEYPTHYAELDHLYQAAGAPVEKRLALFEQHQATVMKKDESLAALIGLKTFAGKADESIGLLQNRTFSLWEGGTQFSTGEAWADAQLVRGLQNLRAKKFPDALTNFEAALSPPKNLRAEDRGGARRAEFSYWTGVAQAGLGEPALAEKSWTDAAAAQSSPEERGGGFRRQNSLGRSAQRYYQALAQQKLSATSDVHGAFHDLVNAGEAALKSSGGATDTAPAGPSEPLRNRMAAAHYIAGLGHAGLEEKDAARKEFTAALTSQPDHLGAKLALEQLD
jgi:tetratricopeptide (TPR) repeat protein